MSRIAARIAAPVVTVGALVAVAASAHAATPRYVGGTPVGPPSSAPFTVLVVAASGSGLSLCTGSIIDQTHVLTAAHCTMNDQGQRWPAASYIIGIGFSSFDSDDGVVGPVRSVRVHPDYDPATGRADVAVLEVPPIATGPTMAPIPLVAVGTPLAPGSVVRGYGWGETGSAASDDVEQMLDLTVGAPTDCWSGTPAVGCAHSSTGSPCPGDSGGPIVQNGIQVAVTNTRTGLNCAPGSTLGFVDLSAPGIGLFVRGDDRPPAMPFATAPASLTPPPLTGGAATCAAPAWTNATTTTTVFYRRDAGTVVQEGASSTYAPSASDVGHELGCRSIAQSAGGRAVAQAPSGFSVLASKLSVRAGRRVAAISYSGAPSLALTATLTKAKRNVWSRNVGTARTVRLPTKLRPGRYRLCVDAPAAGQFAAAQDCQRWRVKARRHR